MPHRDSFLTSRRLLIGSIIFGLFVLFDIGLFSWLIFDSLSEREIEKVILEAREEVEPLVEELEKQAGNVGDDLWVVVTVVEDTRTYIQDVLEERAVVQKIEIRDHNGTVVFSGENSEQLPPSGDFVPEVRTVPLEIPLPEALEEVELPIGSMGTLVIGLSKAELQKRVGVLRQDLIRQASVIGVLTVTLLAVAFAAVWWLIRRSRRLEEQALEAERLAYIGTLASGLAHEIRNPLNALSLNMQMLEEEARESGSKGSGLRLVGITRAEIGRLERLVTDFLSYARPRPLELETVAPAVLLERTAEVLAGEIQKRGAEVTVENHAGDAAVRVDREQMSQLLLNLTQNALNATEEVDRTPVVRLIARAEITDVVLEVVDNGCGMQDADRPRIFDLFYSTRKGGTGLGLAIVERIAKAHEASLEVASVAGCGTTLRLRLPAAAPHTAAASDLSAPGPAAQPAFER